VLVFFTWVVRGVADTVSMWDAVERITSFATNVPEEDKLLAVRGAPDAAGAGAALALPAPGKGGAATVSLQLADVKVDPASCAVSLQSWPKKGDLRFEGVCLRCALGVGRGGEGRGRARAGPERCRVGCCGALR
jgi:hypothetical protein